jgi:HAD superfamily hydrolase (TIGR01549 family)
MVQATMRWRGRAILFDLFGTVVHFVARVPAIQTAGSQWRAAMQWLREAAARDLPQIAFEDLLTVLMRVTEEIVRQRPPDYREVPSRERFRRALRQLGVEAERAPEIAARLSLAHMSHLASMTAVHPGNVRLLAELAPQYRLGLISNFDHGPTVRRILTEHGLAQFFSAILISDDFGQRKPHPAIFEAALRALGVTAADALFIGDSVSDDVGGAHNVRLPVAWLNAKREILPPDVPAPDYVIAELTELPLLLA